MHRRCCYCVMISYDCRQCCVEVSDVDESAVVLRKVGSVCGMLRLAWRTNFVRHRPCEEESQSPPKNSRFETCFLDAPLSLHDFSPFIRSAIVGSLPGTVYCNRIALQLHFFMLKTFASTQLVRAVPFRASISFASFHFLQGSLQHLLVAWRIRSTYPSRPASELA
jgi:hypothetical protein